jgi:hypothetical protein
MPVERGDEITNTHFNTLVTALVNNYASFFGQKLRPGTTTKQVGQTISESHWADLAQDVYDYANFAWTGEAFNLSTIFTNSIWRTTWDIPADRKVEDIDYNELETAINSANLRVSNILDSDMPSLSDSAEYTTDGWNNGSVQVDATITFQGGYEYTISVDGTTAIASGADHIRHYSRTNARITSIGTGNGATSDKDLDWVSVAESLNEPWRPSDYTGANFITLESSQGGANYGDNVGRILIKRNTTEVSGSTIYSFTSRIEYQENDAGNDPNADPIYDENVDANVGQQIVVRYPNRLPNDLQPFVEMSTPVLVGFDAPVGGAVDPVWALTVPHNTTYFNVNVNEAVWFVTLANSGSDNDFFTSSVNNDISYLKFSSWHPDSAWQPSDYEFRLTITEGTVTPQGNTDASGNWFTKDPSEPYALFTATSGVGFRRIRGTMDVRRKGPPEGNPGPVASLEFNLVSEVGGV